MARTWGGSLAILLALAACQSMPRQTTDSAPASPASTSAFRADNLGHRADPGYRDPISRTTYATHEANTHASGHDASARGARKTGVGPTPPNAGVAGAGIYYPGVPPPTHWHHHDARTRIAHRPLGVLPPTPSLAPISGTADTGRSAVDEGAPEHQTYRTTDFTR